MIKAIFFDRDGVLIEDTGYVYKTEDLKWKSGAIDAIKYLNFKKILVIVITNQSGVGRGYYTKRDVRFFHNHMLKILKQHNAWIDKFYFSPYYNKSKKYSSYYFFNLRKPNIGMLKKAKNSFFLKKKEILMIGDKETDCEAAQKFKVRFVYKSNKSLFVQTKNLVN